MTAPDTTWGGGRLTACRRCDPVHALLDGNALRDEKCQFEARARQDTLVATHKEDETGNLQELQTNMLSHVRHVLP